MRRAESVLPRHDHHRTRLQRIRHLHANLLLDAGEHEASLAALEAALQISDEDTGTRATIVCDIGDLQETHGELARALDNRERCVAAYESLLGPDNPRLGIPLLGLGKTTMRIGDFEGALAVFQRAERVLAQVPSARRASRGGAMFMIAQNLVRLQRLDEAQEWFRRSIALLEGVEGGAGNLYGARVSFAMTFVDTGDPAEAARQLEAVIADEPPGARLGESEGSARINLASAYAEAGERGAAIRWAKEARTVFEQNLTPGTRPYAQMLRVLAGISLDVGAHEEALALTEQALAAKELGGYERGLILWFRARALHGTGDEAAARDAATGARALMIAEGDAGRQWLPDIEAWLDAQGE